MKPKVEAKYKMTLVLVQGVIGAIFIIVTYFIVKSL